MADNGRKMIYPITISQSIKYFPFRYHWKHMPRFKECFIAAVLLFPAVMFIQNASFAPANVKKYEDYLKKEKREHEAHMRHLEGYYEDKHKH